MVTATAGRSAAAGNTVTFADNATVTVAVSSLPTEFNPSTPAGSNAVTQMVMEQVWPQPFVIANGMVARAGPGLVASAELVSVKPQTVEYTLAKNARWSDGVPISAADFVYDWKQFLAEGPLLTAAFPIAGYQSIASISGIDAGRTVRVVFRTPYSDWDALFGNLVPAHIAERYGWSAAFAGFSPKRVISGGPFAITKVIPGKELVLSRNRDYWGAPARLAHIVFVVEPSQSATLRALAAGTVDLAQLTPSPEVDETVRHSKDLEGTPSYSPILWQLDFNLADPVVSSLAVRQAIAAAINRNELVADSVGLDASNAAPAHSHLFGSGTPGYRPNDGAYPDANPPLADQLLGSAHYVIDPAGTAVNLVGKPLTLSISAPTDNPAIASVENVLQAELLQAGISLRIHNVRLSTLLTSTLPQGDYQLAIAPYLLSRYPSTTSMLYTGPDGSGVVTPTGYVRPNTPTPLKFATQRDASRTEPAASAAGVVTRDVLGFASQVVAAEYTQAFSDLNFDSATDLYNAIDAALWSEMVTLPLFEQPIELVARDNILNLNETATWAGPMWNAENWAVQISPPPTTSTSTPAS